MAKKRLAVDVSWIDNSGIGRVAKEILKRLPDEWDVVPIRKGVSSANILTPLSLASYQYRIKADVLWSPGFMPPLVTGNIPVIVTVHDLTHLHYYTRYHKYYYNNIIRPLLKRVTRIVTVSDYTKRELEIWLNIKKENIVRIYNGVGAEFNNRVDKTKLRRPYILYVGNHRKYKNVDALIKAYALSGLADKGYDLVLTGKKKESYKKIEKNFDLDGRITYLGFVAEEDLPSLYRGAHVLAFVSKYEGFGLPIIEAMACGVPVLTSNKSSMKEISNNSAVLVDPFCVEDISKALHVISNDTILRKNLICAGYENASKYTWDKAAEQYFLLFDQVAGK